jgi:hypothetical protein
MFRSDFQHLIFGVSRAYLFMNCLLETELETPKTRKSLCSVQKEWHNLAAKTKDCRYCFANGNTPNKETEAYPAN